MSSKSKQVTIMSYISLYEMRGGCRYEEIEERRFFWDEGQTEGLSASQFLNDWAHSKFGHDVHHDV
jgi:hypothetical protein